MIDQLSNVELDAIERRIDSATAGPWFSYVVGRNTEAGCNCIELGTLETMELLGGTVADQDFVAMAREDLPRLLQEVRVLRARLQEAQALRRVAGVTKGNADTAALLPLLAHPRSQPA